MQNTFLTAVVFLISLASPSVPAAAQHPPTSSPRAVLNTYCVSCHNEKLKTADLMLDKVEVDHPAENPAIWEKVLRKLRAREMPPPERPRPDDATYDSVVAYLETALDQAAEAKPNPGRPSAYRLNRSQYANAIRDQSPPAARQGCDDDCGKFRAARIGYSSGWRPAEAFYGECLRRRPGRARRSESRSSHRCGNVFEGHRKIRRHPGFDGESGLLRRCRHGFHCRPVWCESPRRHTQPAKDFNLPAVRTQRRRNLRNQDHHDLSSSRLPSPDQSGRDPNVTDSLPGSSRGRDFRRRNPDGARADSGVAQFLVPRRNRSAWDCSGHCLPYP